MSKITNPTPEEIRNAMTPRERMIVNALEERLTIFDWVIYPDCGEEMLAAMKAQTAKGRGKFERQIKKIEDGVRQRLLSD